MNWILISAYNTVEIGNTWRQNSNLDLNVFGLSVTHLHKKKNCIIRMNQLNKQIELSGKGCTRHQNGCFARHLFYMVTHVIATPPGIAPLDRQRRILSQQPPLVVDHSTKHVANSETRLLAKTAGFPCRRTKSWTGSSRTTWTSLVFRSPTCSRTPWTPCGPSHWRWTTP